MGGLLGLRKILALELGVGEASEFFCPDYVTSVSSPSSGPQRDVDTTSWEML